MAKKRKTKSKKKKLKLKLKPKLKRSLKPKRILPRSKSQHIKSKRIYKLKRSALLERKRFKRKKKKVVKESLYIAGIKYRKSIRKVKKKAKLIRLTREKGLRKVERERKSYIHKIAVAREKSEKKLKRRRIREVKREEIKRITKQKKVAVSLKKKEERRKIRLDIRERRIRRTPLPKTFKKAKAIIPLPSISLKPKGMSHREKEEIYLDILSRREPERKKLPFSKKIIDKFLEDEGVKLSPALKTLLKSHAKEKLEYAALHLEYDIDIEKVDGEFIDSYGNKTQVYDNPYDAVAEIDNHMKNIEDSPKVKKAHLINYRVEFHSQLDF